MPYTGSQAFSGEGSILSIGNGGSPEVFTEVMELKNINFTGAKADLADVTNMNSGAFREFVPTLLDSGEANLTGNYIPSDPGQVLMQGIWLNRQKAWFQIVEPLASVPAGKTNPGVATFYGFVSDPGYPDLDATKEATFSAKIKITGQRFYAEPS